MKIFSLDWEKDDPIFNFHLIGLDTTFINDYDLAFFLNKHLNLALRKTNDHKLSFDKMVYSFSLFTFEDRLNGQCIELISNYSYPEFSLIDQYSLFHEIKDIKILIPEYKGFNFFLKSKFLFEEHIYVTLAQSVEIKKYLDISLSTIKLNNLENLILPI